MKNYDKKIKKNAIIILVLIIVMQLLSIINSRKEINTINDNNIKLLNSITDTVTHYEDINGQIVATKASMQVEIDYLEENNVLLSDSKNRLLKRVNELNKKNKLIAAALIETRIKIDSLEQPTVTIDSIASIVNFSDSNDLIQYNIDIINVRPANLLLPILKFNSFELFNEQTITFNWGTRKDNYPVSFSVTNSNPYFQTTNIESYVIPQVDKEIIDPKKFNLFFKKKVKPVAIFSAGAGLMYLILK